MRQEMDNDAAMRERCAELDAQEKRVFELLQEAEELQEKCEQCQNQKDWVQAQRYLKEALEKQRESKVLMETVFKTTMSILETECSDILAMLEDCEAELK